MLKRLPATFTTYSLISIGLVAAVLAGLALAKEGPARGGAPTYAALAVETGVITPQESFAMQRTFSGRVEARRQSGLGFELAGRLARVWVEEGAVVEAGQRLAELDTERLEAQRSELVAAHAEAKANLSLAEVTFKRLRSIVDKGGVSQQELDESRETLRAAEAALSLAGQRISTIDIELGKSRLVAPFAAVVIARLADEGHVLEAGYPVLTLQERAVPEIRIGVAGRTLEQLQPGRLYPVSWHGQTFEARLRVLLPVRAVATRTVDALFDPIDPPSGLLTGDMVTLTLESSVKERGSWLPLSALAEGKRGLWSVYVAEPLERPVGEPAATHRISRHTVDVVYNSGDRVYVKGPLKPDQRVVISGLQRVVPGQPVRLANSVASVAELNR